MKQYFFKDGLYFSHTHPSYYLRYGNEWYYYNYGFDSWIKFYSSTKEEDSALLVYNRYNYDTILLKVKELGSYHPEEYKLVTQLVER